MNQPLDAGFELDKSAEVHQLGHRAGDALASLEAFGNGLPGFGLKLFEPEGDFLAFGVDFENFDLNLLADGEHVSRLFDARVGKVGDVQQAIEATNVNKSAVRDKAADRASNRIALVQRFAAGLDEAAGLLFENDAAINDHILAGDVELGDAAGNLRADQFLHLGFVVGSAAAGGHEGWHANIHREAALADLGDRADDGGFVGEGGLQGRPVARLGDFEARKHIVVLLVAAGDGNREAVAGVDAFGVVLEGGAGQNALGLVANVEEDLVGRERNDGARELPLAGLGLVRVAVLELVEQVGKGLDWLFWRGFRLGNGRGRGGGNRRGRGG